MTKDKIHALVDWNGLKHEFSDLFGKSECSALLCPDIMC
jgi:hypothetical protein